MAALAAVAVISVAALNSLTGRVAPDTPQSPDVVVAEAPPAPAPAQREIEPAPAPPPVQRAIEPAPPAPPPTPKEDSRPARPIAPPNRERASVQAAVPPPVAARAVDTALASLPPAATATTGVRPTNTVSNSRIDIVPTPAPVAAPVAAVVASPPPAAAPVSSPPPPVAAAPSPPSTARAVPPAALIEVVLERYAAAFSALDAGRAKAVWPAVNERNLARAFESLEQQEFDLGDCEITVAEPRAVASCRGTARYTPRMGSRRMRTESRQWTFTLESKGDTWSIASVDSR